MANEVVLGDLALDSRPDCMQVQSSTTQYIDIPNNPNYVEFHCESDNTSNVMYMGNGAFAERGYVILRESINLYSSGGTLSQHPISIPAGAVDIIVEKTSSQISVRINGVQILTDEPYTESGGNNLRLCNYKYPQTYYGLGCCVYSVITSTHTYINEGDFGSPVLPSNPSGADGSYNGATWWKKGVDENYATSQLYKSTLVSPLTEDQHVVYTDAEPYYASDDVFWNPFNQDANFGFTVAPLGGTGSIGIAGLNRLGISMTISF